MGYVTILELPAVENVLPLTAGDVMPIVHGATTYNVDLSTLQQYFNFNIALSAAGKQNYVQFASSSSALCADPGFVYIPQLSSLQIGFNNVMAGLYGGILGGYQNTNYRNNAFIIGSNLTTFQDNLTLVNAISAQNYVYDTTGNSSQWSTAYTYIVSQSSISTTVATITTPVAFNALPSKVAGMRAFVNNCNTAVFGGLANGAGLLTVPVWTDGIEWYVG